MGSLIHELTHLAMDILFSNKCQPFDACDIHSKNELEAIVEEYRRMRSNMPLVDKVFSYSSAEQSIEMIVRVPHMIAHYHENSLQLMRAEAVYHKLFTFYNLVLGKIDEFMRDPIKFKFIRLRQEINDHLGYLDNYEKHFTQDRLLDRNLLTPVNIQVLGTDVPQLTFSIVIQSLERLNLMSELRGSYIFAETRDFEIDYYYRRFKQLATIKTTFVFNHESQPQIGSQEAMKRFTEFLKKKSLETKVIIICRESERTSLKNFNISVSETFIVHTWNELNAATRDMLLEKEILFQNKLMKLRHFVKRDSLSLKHLPLQYFFKNDPLTIGTSIKTNVGYETEHFIDRTLFNDTKIIDCATNFLELLEEARNKRSVIIADEAGKGKSTFLSDIAIKIQERSKEFWIVRVDLNQHANAFKYGTFNDTALFIQKHFVRTHNNFERMIFMEHFNEGKVIVLLDGFDEIVPYFKNECLTFLKKLKTSNIAQVWITTRFHLVSELENILGQKSFFLQPFSRQDQVDFMMKFWRKQLQIAEVGNIKLEDCATRIIDGFESQLCNKNTNFIGIPLQARMIAEIFQDDVKAFIENDVAATFDVSKLSNILCMYRHFVSTKIQIVQTEKNGIVAKEKADMEAEGVNVIEIHEKLSLKLIFGKESDYL